MTYAMHVREAERLVNKSVDGDTRGSMSDLEDATLRLAWATQAQAHATLALVASQPAQPEVELTKVWVATVSDENDSPGPAVYVSPTEADLEAVIRKQQGAPLRENLHDWAGRKGKLLVIDSYYVEAADD